MVGAATSVAGCVASVGRIVAQVRAELEGARGMGGARGVEDMAWWRAVSRVDDLVGLARDAVSQWVGTANTDQCCVTERWLITMGQLVDLYPDAALGMLDPIVEQFERELRQVREHGPWWKD